MYTALRATSITIATCLEQSLRQDPILRAFFDPALGGNMEVTLNNPEEMAQEGVSVWLYQVRRDGQRLNAPPVRIARDQEQREPLPLCLYYLITPILELETNQSPETEQAILGKVLQTLHDTPRLAGVHLRDDFQGSDVELICRLQALSLEEITRIWDALNQPYQLSVSYEVSVVNIASAKRPVAVSPVQVALPEYGIIVEES